LELRDHQWPDGTVVWTSPHGQTYTTRPGSKLLFPALCRPTAPAARRDVPDTANNRALAISRRNATRAQNSAKAINDERQHYEHAIQTEGQAAQRSRPPPF